MLDRITFRLYDWQVLKRPALSYYCSCGVLRCRDDINHASGREGLCSYTGRRAGAFLCT